MWNSIDLMPQFCRGVGLLNEVTSQKFAVPHISQNSTHIWFRCHFKSGSPAIQNPNKWQPCCPKPFENWTGLSGIQMVHKKIENWTFFCLVFKWSGFWMVCLLHSFYMETDHLNTGHHFVQYSNVSGIQILTAVDNIVDNSSKWLLWSGVNHMKLIFM